MVQFIREASNLESKNFLAPKRIEEIKTEKFIDALEASSLDPEWKPTTPAKPPLTDIEAIRRLMAKRIQKK